MNSTMNVVKRCGKTEPVKFDKIAERIEKLCFTQELKNLDIPMVVQKLFLIWQI